MNKRNPSLFPMAGFLTVGVIPGWDKGIIMLRSIGSVAFLSLLMVGCGGGGSGGGGSLATYSIGGTVTGLTGSGLLLQTNQGDVVPVSGAGAFTFANQLGTGAAYTVTVKTQPSAPVQNCTVSNGSGTVGTANVTTVAVACSTVAGYTVGGTVSGLVGSDLTLAICTRPGNTHGVPTPDSCSNKKHVSANGTYTLDTVYLADYSGLDYVSIAQEPSSPPQRCVISNAAVSAQAANDTGFTVSCAGFSYVTNAADDTLSVYSIDATTGALAVIGTPTVTGDSPYATVGLEDGNARIRYEGNGLTVVDGIRYVFVGNEFSNDVSAFAVNSTTGALTAVRGSPFPAGKDPQALALLNDVSQAYYLYVANAGSGDVSAYEIDEGTGALNPLFGPGASTIATGENPTSIAIGGQFSFAQFVYVANHGGSNDISAFNSDLTPVPGSPFPARGNPLSLAVGAGGKFLYSANPDATNPTISGFTIDGIGALTPLSGSPFPLPVSHYIATDQTGAYLYVTAGANIVGYAIDATTGALTALPGFPVSAGADPYSVSIDPTNRFLYVANHGGANIAGFRLDASSGALTRISGSPFQAGSHSEFIATF
jgi:6-phosphogluconolactonase (cycloisomerase 2 family)